MAVNRYRAGRRAEYKVVDEMRKCGVQAVRTAGSHGPFDVIAWGKEWLYLIQVKCVRDYANVPRARAESERAFDAAVLPVGGGVVAQTCVLCGGKFVWFNYTSGGRERRT